MEAGAAMVGADAEGERAGGVGVVPLYSLLGLAWRRLVNAVTAAGGFPREGTERADVVGEEQGGGGAAAVEEGGGAAAVEEGGGAAAEDAAGGGDDAEQALFEDALAEAVRRARAYQQYGVEDIPRFRIKVKITAKKFRRLMRQRFRRIKLLCSMLIAGHPVTAPDIVAKFMFHIVEIVEGKKSLQLLFRDSDLYFLGFRLNDDPKFYVFANEELPEWIQRYTLPYGAGYDITVANVTLGPHCFDAIWKHMFEFTPKNYDTYDSDTRLILFWIMITMSETLRSRSLQEKVERTLETGVVEQVGALLDLKIHGWSHDSKDTFGAVSRNDMNWELLGSAGDLLTLKFSAPEALPVIIGRQKKVAEEAAAALAEISHLLEAHLCTNSDQAHNWEQLQHYSQLPNFNNYLIFLFAHAQEQSVQVRQAAGLVLKNNLRSTFSSMPPSSQSYIKSELLTCIGSPEKEIRSTAGTVTSVLLQIVGFDGWDYLFQTLRQCLGSDNLDQKEGAADAIYKICEDLPKDFNVDDDVSELVHDFMPRLLQLFECPSASLRKLALHCVNQCIVVLPSVLTMFRDQYLEGVLSLSAETSPDFKRLVCSSLTQLIELHQVIPEHHLKTAIEFVLHSTRDLDDNLAMEACKFWSVYCYSSMFPEGLQEVLEGLIQTLARNIVYTDKSILKILLDIKVNESISDRDQNLKRCFHASRLHGPEMGKVNDDDDDDDAVNAWNLREYSAAGLECFSKALGNGILPILMPLIKANLVRSDDDAWKDREAAVLCIDTIAEGCMNGLQPHLPQIVPLLTLLLDDKYPLVRSITCQTISRYSKFIVQSGDHEQFVKIMKVLAKRILDANKRVHEAACSAFVTIGKEAAEFVGLETVLQHLMLDYGKHQTRDLHLISDTICTLADAVGAKLNKTSCLDIIVNPLIMKWQQLQYSDKDLLPLLECFTSIAQAVGSGCSQFAEVVFKKCLKLIDFQQLAKADPAAPSFIVCSLDLLSGLAEALGAGIENLVGQSNLIEVLMHCCKDETAGVRRSALALLGKLSRVCHTHVHSNLQEFLKVAAEQLTWVSVKVATPVANCACWVIGELAIKFGQEIAPTVTIILSGLVPIVRSSEGLDKIFVGNSAIALGRLSLFFPEIVSSRMKRSMQAWCNALCMTGNNLEREEAFSGLCSVVEANPARAVGSLSDVCKAFATLQDIQSKELGSKEAGACEWSLGAMHGYPRSIRGAQIGDPHDGGAADWPIQPGAQLVML